MLLLFYMKSIFSPKSNFKFITMNPNNNNPINVTNDDSLKIEDEYYEIDGKQVKIYCYLCRSWQILTQQAANILPDDAINYYLLKCEGRCMRAVCEEEFEKKEKEIKYVMYPANYKAQRPDIDARQAEIFCHRCDTWQPLNIENYRTLPFGCDDHKKNRYDYPDGRCCRPECEEKNGAKYWQDFDDRFHAQESQLQSRCDAADAKVDATWNEHLKQTAAAAAEKEQKRRDKIDEEEMLNFEFRFAEGAARRNSGWDTTWNDHLARAIAKLEKEKEKK